MTLGKERERKAFSPSEKSTALALNYIAKHVSQVSSQHFYYFYKNLALAWISGGKERPAATLSIKPNKRKS